MSKPEPIMIVRHYQPDQERQMKAVLLVLGLSTQDRATRKEDARREKHPGGKYGI